MRIDHVAHPSRDPAATHRFYSEVLKLRLIQAYAGPELMLVYRLPGGGSLVFSARRGDTRSPGDGMAWERRHVGLTVPTHAEFDAWLQRLKECGVRHELVDEERIYFADPDGLVLELEVESPASDDDPAASEVVERWLSS